MPVHRFAVREDGSPGEVMVRVQGAGWAEEVADPESPGLAEAVRALQAAGLALEPGYASEIDLRMGPWLAALGEAVGCGLALFIDYGYPRAEYYRAERRTGTLLCHARHRAHADPYRHIGLQDITAHVDFSALARAGLEAGWTLAGYSTQAHFLLGCGLDGLLAEAAVGEDSLDLLLAAKQLVLPSAMGERFQVLGLAKGVSGDWCGFSLRDLSGRL
jgi:SAM-dependent MidA family methyltransferase